MELAIYTPQENFLKEIKWNNEELKKELTEKVEMYNNLVYTDKEIKDAKADRAKLNKLKEAIESRRKELKSLCLEPYNKFETDVKEVLEVINVPINAIDTQIKEVEKQKKLEKFEEIKAFYNSLEEEFKPELKQIFDDKWLNATVSLAKVKEAINTRLESIKTDLVTLSKLPDFAFESIEIYKSTLDINTALNEGQRLADIQKRKLEAEARKQEQERLKQEMEEQKKAEAQEEIKAEAPTEEPKQWVSFMANLTVTQARELKEFFEVRKIEFKAV